MTVWTPSPGLYSPVSETLARRSAIVEITGPTGSGKTALALSGPGPIAYLHSGETASGLLEKVAAQGKQIYKAPFGGGPTFLKLLEGGNEEAIKAQAALDFRSFRNSFLDGLRGARSVIIDTHPSLYLISRYAAFGAPKNAPSKTSQLEYGDVNSIWNGIMQVAHAEAEKRDFLFVLLSQTKDEWENYIDEKGNKARRTTGRLTRETHQEVVPNKANINIWTESAPFERRFGFRVGKAWMNSHWLGWGVEDNQMGEDGKLAWGLPEILGWVTETSAEEWAK